MEEKVVGMTARDNDKAFIANFNKYAFVGMMLEWIRTGLKDNPEAIINRFSILIHGDIPRALKTLRLGHRS